MGIINFKWMGGAGCVCMWGRAGGSGMYLHWEPLGLVYRHLVGRSLRKPLVPHPHLFLIKTERGWLTSRVCKSERSASFSWEALLECHCLSGALLCMDACSTQARPCHNSHVTLGICFYPQPGACQGIPCSSYVLPQAVAHC